LWTSPEEAAISEHVYTGSGGQQLSLTLYLPEYRDDRLSAVVHDEVGLSVFPTLTWTSSDVSVVTASSSGDVSATGIGSATITASADGVTSNSMAVTVSEGTEPFPAILYLHSGGWFQGTQTEFQQHAAHMATKGFVGATIQYRLVPLARFPAQVQGSRSLAPSQCLHVSHRHRQIRSGGRFRRGPSSGDAWHDPSYC